MRTAEVDASLGFDLIEGPLQHCSGGNLGSGVSPERREDAVHSQFFDAAIRSRNGRCVIDVSFGVDMLAPVVMATLSVIEYPLGPTSARAAANDVFAVREFLHETNAMSHESKPSESGFPGRSGGSRDLIAPGGEA